VQHAVSTHGSADARLPRFPQPEPSLAIEAVTPFISKFKERDDEILRRKQKGETEKQKATEVLLYT
jgi:hypothetical protein